MTRITTYTSILTPRFYWEPMERLGVSQEHEYVFNYIEKGLKERYRQVKIQAATSRCKLQAASCKLHAASWASCKLQAASEYSLCR